VPLCRTVAAPLRSASAAQCASLIASYGLQILGLQASMRRDAREHFRSNFFTVMKCKDEIGSPRFDQNGVRSALPGDAPSYSLQGRK
jgi:hypothetical protein